MRQVILDGRNGSCADPRLRDKLTGHLNARLAEYEEDGLFPIPTGPGELHARFDGLSGLQAARQMEQRGVYVRAEGDYVCFLVGPDVTFEDLDYVQSVAAGLL